jgi:septum formation protein
MYAFSDAFLERYLSDAGNDILGCVGAYQMEGAGVRLFEAVEGDHFAILGMPLLSLLNELRHLEEIDA